MSADTLTPKDKNRQARLIYSYYRPGRPVMSKEELAERAGYSPEYISRLFSGARRISDEAAKSLSKALDIRKEYLLGKDDFMTREDYQKAREIKYSIGVSISEIALFKGFLITAILPSGSIMKAGEKGILNEDMRTKLLRLPSDSNGGMIDLSSQVYAGFDNLSWESICDEVADFVDFKLKQFFTRHPSWNLEELLRSGTTVSKTDSNMDGGNNTVEAAEKSL